MKRLSSRHCRHAADPPDSAIPTSVQATLVWKDPSRSVRPDIPQNHSPWTFDGRPKFLMHYLSPDIPQNHSSCIFAGPFWPEKLPHVVPAKPSRQTSPRITLLQALHGELFLSGALTKLLDPSPLGAMSGGWVLEALHGNCFCPER